MKEGWTTKTLGELSKGNKGFYGIGASAVDYSADKHTYLRISDINDDGTLNKSDLKSVDDPEANKYILQPNDIVFARTGNSTGRNYFYDKADGELVYAGFLIKFSLDNSKVNPKYIKYYVQSTIYKNWVKSFDTGGTRGNINAQTFSQLKIEIPPREQQDLLVNILSSIDEKIKLNKAINDNLEAQAQAIFKSWFVDFESFKDGEFVESELGTIPKGWKVGDLKKIADITMGQSPSGDSYNELGDGMVFYQGRAEFGDRFPTRRLFTTSPNRIAEENSVLFSVRAPVGDVNIATEKCCIGRGLASIKAKENNNAFVFYTMKSLYKIFDIFNSEGTVFGSINRNDLSQLQILIPPNEQIRSFENIASQFDYQILNNFNQNQSLIQLRDTLLPKLMSGEISVDEIEI